MLVISRREKETFYLYPEDLPPDMTVAELFAGGQIAITVNKINSSQVRLGIDAPLGLSILRDDAKPRD